MLPAQLVSFSGEANDGISKGMAAAAVQSLMKVRFFMDENYSAPGQKRNGNHGMSRICRRHGYAAERRLGRRPLRLLFLMEELKADARRNHHVEFAAAPQFQFE